MIDSIMLVVGILNDALDVPVGTEIPSNVTSDVPRELVTVALDGDLSDEFLQRPRMTLTCWGKTNKEAHALAVACVDALRDESLDHPYLANVDLETMSRDLWTRTGQSRYLVVVELTIDNDET